MRPELCLVLAGVSHLVLFWCLHAFLEKRKILSSRIKCVSFTEFSDGEQDVLHGHRGIKKPHLDSVAAGL